MKHFLIIVSAFLSLCGAAQADYITTTGETFTRPLGQSVYCLQDPDFCSPRELVKVDITKALYDELQGVDDHVNRTVLGADDKDIWGFSDYWAMPRDGVADCEDYALLKRQMLIEKGWPVGAFRLVSVTTWDQAGHMVLAVSTTKGDLILDNLAYEVRDWGNIPYTGKRVQSLSHPEKWEKIAQ